MRLLTKIWFVLIAFSFASCSELDSDTEEIKNDKSSKDNYYVGIEECASCHKEQYEGYMQTGMGKSYETAHQGKSVIPRDTILNLYDKDLNLHYRVFWKEDSLRITEFRINKKDTFHSITRTVDYVVGSGHHTNSHIENRNGYLYQMPFTFYTQDKVIDLPPGFESGFNSRFYRKIGLECMSCHNSYPEFVKGSENKFTNVPNGINCERCHGQGGKHVEEMKAGNIVDITKEKDPTIVNPAKLGMKLQFDICQRCHLQGNAVLEPGKSFYDFHPGMDLEEVLTVYLPRYEGDNSSFIMASHADRMQMSQCFISTKDNAKPNSLYPTRGQMTCITCHDPHRPVHGVQDQFYNKTCQSCHEEKKCSKTNEINCISCHMPKSSAIDIPHVSITDHYIRKDYSEPISNEERKFIGLVPVNNKNASNLSRFSAYLNQYEKFGNNPLMLDSAKLLMDKIEMTRHSMMEMIHWYYITNDFQNCLNLIKSEEFKQEFPLDKTFQLTWSNQEAWTYYRIGELLMIKNLSTQAKEFFRVASELSPFNLEFRNKYASVLFVLNKRNEATKEWEFVISEDPINFSALSNLANIKLLNNQLDEAKILLDRSIKANPDYEMAHQNLAQFYLLKEDRSNAVKSLKRILDINPENPQAKLLLKQLQ